MNTAVVVILVLAGLAVAVLIVVVGMQAARRRVVARSAGSFVESILPLSRKKDLERMLRTLGPLPMSTIARDPELATSLRAALARDETPRRQPDAQPRPESAQPVPEAADARDEATPDPDDDMPSSPEPLAQDHPTVESARAGMRRLVRLLVERAPGVDVTSSISRGAHELVDVGVLTEGRRAALVTAWASLEQSRSATYDDLPDLEHAIQLINTLLQQLRVPPPGIGR